jgi:uncharacterized protein HemX
MLFGMVRMSRGPALSCVALVVVLILGAVLAFVTGEEELPHALSTRLPPRAGESCAS